ncbi:MAG TPA: sugar phosphate isomerase/epimerase family protein [Verrucomicrobiae bacterium]|nr:sugar phosphate isomerase/epimerase family protein [Verrucomicrobiae bacterium]
MSSVGIQLYSVRKQMQKDVPGTLDEVRSWGIKYVELAGNYGLSPQDFKAQLDEHHLIPIGGHFGFEQWEKDPEAVLREAKILGLKYVGCAWIPHNGKFDEATCQKAVEVFNHAGELAAEQKMQFFYHTHGYEFQPYDDGTLFDYLVQHTDPKNVKFEMDIFWIAHSGTDPVKLMEKYPKRFVLMHLKDMKNGTKTGLLTGSSDVNNDVTLGAGQLDLPAILHEARKIGIKYYFIEDESDSSEKQIPDSLRYLEDFKD